jgi:hypothetical protein
MPPLSRLEVEKADLCQYSCVILRMVITIQVIEVMDTILVIVVMVLLMVLLTLPRNRSSS